MIFKWNQRSLKTWICDAVFHLFSLLYILLNPGIGHQDIPPPSDQTSPAGI